MLECIPEDAATGATTGHRSILEHVKIFRTVPTDAHDLGSQSIKLLLVLTKLRGLNRASRCASLCNRLYNRLNGKNLHRRDTVIVCQGKHALICIKRCSLCIHEQSIALLLQVSCSSLCSKQQVTGDAMP